MQGFNASYLKVLQALSPNHFAGTNAFTNASNFAGYEVATLFVTVGSCGGSMGLEMQRSGTSGGTFATFGASLPVLTAGCRTSIRSFTLDSSATWYRVRYDGNNGGSVNADVKLILSNGRNAPVSPQDSRVTVYSDVLGG